MRRYRVMAELYKYDFDIEDVKERIENAKHWTVTQIIIAENSWDACEKFGEEFYCDEEYDEMDDIRAEEIGPVPVYITSRRESYTDDMYEPTMTVGELIELLQRDFDDDSPIYTVDFGGYNSTKIYGHIDIDSVWEKREE